MLEHEQVKWTGVTDDLLISMISCVYWEEVRTFHVKFSIALTIVAQIFWASSYEEYVAFRRQL